MLNNGVPLEVVSKILGHGGYAITADIYAEVQEELQRNAADVMDSVLRG
jgi:site-specific recombinase XerD